MVEAQVEVATALTRILDYIRWGASRFAAAGLTYGHGTDNAVDEAAHLVLDVLGFDHNLPDAYLQALLTPRERAAAMAVVERRIETRLPAPYITGKAWFAGLEFFVDQRVIVPRSPISELIESRFQPWLGDREPLTILDLCTGCGAIAIACVRAFPDARVVATDASDQALEVAAINCERHDIGPQIECVKSDIFDGLDSERFDLIVSNPPYVTLKEYSGLDPEFQHEPGFAFHGDADDLILIERILFEAPDYLADDGLLVFEVGASLFLLEARYPDLPVTWVDLEFGGMGVGVIEADELVAWVELHRGDQYNMT